MTKEVLVATIGEKYEELVGALECSNIERIREQALEVHAMVHPAEISGKTEKNGNIKRDTKESQISIRFIPLRL